MADVTSYVTVTVVSFNVKDPNGNAVTVMRGSGISDDPSDYSVQMPAERSHNGEIVLDLTAGEGRTFANGDEIAVPIRAYAATGARTNICISAPTDWSDLKNSSNTIIGKWRISGSATAASTRTLNITLNSNASGQAFLDDLTVNFGTKGIRTCGIGRPCVGKIKIADEMFSYAIQERNKVTFSDSSFQATASNNNALCGIRIGAPIYNDLINTRGTSTHKSVMFESYYEDALSAELERITYNLGCPYSLTEANGTFVVDWITANFASALTEITQASGESYATFKSRVMSAPLQYGFFKDSGGVHVVYYGGVAGEDTPLYTAYRNDDLADAVARSNIENGWWDETDYNALYAIYHSALEVGDVGKHIVTQQMAVDIYYETALEDEEHPSQAIVTYNPGLSSESSKTYSPTIKLTGMFGTVTVQPFAVTIMKFDSVAKTPLSGAQIKLQISSGGQWIDYTASDGGALVRETGDDGLLTFSNLGTGTYRAVEIQAPSGYDLTMSDQYDADLRAVVSDTFTISATDKEGAKVQIPNVEEEEEDTVINIDCSSCSELQENAATFVQNGVTTKVCNSLKNDTGFNPSLTTLHTDCEDLDAANDCLIGMMDKEVESYDVCEWKEFVHKFIPNIYQLTKAEICAICGLWTNVHDLQDKTDALCDLLDHTVNPPLVDYAVMPLYSGQSSGVVTGHVTDKIAFHADDGSLNPYVKNSQGIGIEYASLQTTSCSTGKCVYYEWIQPKIFYTYIKEGTKTGDVLWYASKSEMQSACGITDYLWGVFTRSSWTWHDCTIQNGSSAGKTVALTITVNPGDMGEDYIGVVFAGSSYPYESETGYDWYPGAISQVPRLYTHSC